MAEVTMPKMGDAMEEGTIRQWLKKEGEPVEDQEPIAEIETEKATIEIPAFEAGTLSQILIREGQTVPVGTPIAVIQAAGEPAPAARPPAQDEPARAPARQGEAPPREGEAPAEPAAASREGEAPAEPAPQAQNQKAAPSDLEEQPDAATPAPPGSERAPAGSTEAEPGPAPARQPSGAAPRPQPSPAPGDENGRVKASPLARKIAAERGIDLRQIHGTGPGGRIVEADLEEVLTTRPEPPPAPREAPPPHYPTTSPPQPRPAAEERELSPIRRTIARRLLESKQTIPHYYVTSEIDMKSAMAWREQVNAADPERPKITVNDMIVRACALALRNFPAVRSQLVENKLRILREVHVGVAVSLTEGLIVPVIRNADQKSVLQISAETRDLAERARAGRLKPDEFSGGTFTISNLGMYDVESFCAIINPPEVAILAVGTAAELPVVENGQLTVGLRMKVTLSADHRVVDGAVAAQFLQEVKRLLQKPMLLV